MNITEFLLTSDIKPMKLPERKLEIKRLSELFEQPFIVTFRALKPSEEEEITKDCMTIKKDEVELDSSRLKYVSVGQCLLDPDVRNKELQSKYGVPNYYGLLEKLFLPGEVDVIYNHIQDLSGYGKDKVEEVKNS